MRVTIRDGDGGVRRRPVTQRAGLRPRFGRWRLGAGLGALMAALVSGQAAGESLSDALVRTYQGNPQLNAERAKLRATDENVPQALSGYRPSVTAELSAGLQAVRNLLPGGESQSATLKPWQLSLQISQTLFNGLKTANTVRQAEAQVKSGREALRSTEQTVLLDAVTAYMNVIANQSLVEALRLSVTFLRETLGTTRRRYEAGDVTPTDVAQAEARLSRGTADLNNAEVNLAVSQATYKEVTGAPPGRLAPAEPIDRLLPPRKDEAIAMARRENPTVLGATYDLDAAQFAIKIAESALFPTLGVQASASRASETDPTLSVTRTDQASIVGTLNVPIYDGGLAPSQVRQAKETLSQLRVLLERTRSLSETAVVAAWVTHEGAKVSLSAAESEVRAATLALEGVQKEALAGQRTTLDVLNAQQDLVSARARRINAQRDRVVASYTLLAAIGRLDHARLGLKTPDYEPQTHYHQVRDAWHGLRTPAGQ
jgi:outer membrane protein